MDRALTKLVSAQPIGTANLKEVLTSLPDIRKLPCFASLIGSHSADEP